MILEVSPEASRLIRAGAALILILHVGAGIVGLLSGAAALSFRKGGRLHRAAGNVFFVSMLIMAGIGACVAPFLPARGSAVGGVLTFYLVATAWMTVRRKEGTIGRFELGAPLVALCGAVADLAFGLQAAHSPTGLLDGIPPLPHYIFAGVATLAAAGDFRMIRHGGISGVPRIVRHLWRMCLGLFIAAGSLFLGQQQVFPEYMRGSAFLVAPAVAPLVLMMFWLLRVRFTSRFRQVRGSAAAAPVA